MRVVLVSVSWTALVALTATCATAQDKPPSNGTTLPPVQVEAPKQAPVRRQAVTSSRSARTARTGTRSASGVVAAPPAPSTGTQRGGPSTPLNTNVVAQGASRLGLTPRETPATVEVVGADTIREQGYHTTIDTVKGATGVTAGDAPNDVAFAMRGFQGNQVNVTYNGINVGPTGFTFLTAETFNLDRVEFLKGPSSLMTGQGAVGGSINYVTKAPHTGPVQNEAFIGFDSYGSYRTGYGSGGSTNIKGLDYRFDISRSDVKGFIDDTDTQNLHVSGQLNYRLSETFKMFGAVEYKDYKAQVSLMVLWLSSTL